MNVSQFRGAGGAPRIRIWEARLVLSAALLSLIYLRISRSPLSLTTLHGSPGLIDSTQQLRLVRHTDLRYVLCSSVKNCFSVCSLVLFVAVSVRGLLRVVCCPLLRDACCVVCTCNQAAVEEPEQISKPPQQRLQQQRAKQEPEHSKQQVSRY